MRSMEWGRAEAPPPGEWPVNRPLKGEFASLALMLPQNLKRRTIADRDVLRALAQRYEDRRRRGVCI